MHPSPKISLVGAGPGDPDLITLKAIKTLRTADVVLYDALVSEVLLTYAPETAQLVFVGKRAGYKRFDQSEINEMLVTYARASGHVVRLKGGDPFVFGRGHEELVYADRYGVEVQIVPGISSVAAVPGLQQIPLTKRGINDSFWVLTATKAGGHLTPDLYQAAQSDATIVIFMGLRKLREIVEIFEQYGKAETPVAVIQSGSTPQEKIAIGTVETIEQAVKKGGVTTPALIVIGEVVGLHPDFVHKVQALTQAGIADKEIPMMLGQALTV
ncbi:MAG: uroporphyrinogen-III C-methyltransferase [Bacteroidota bacterium]